VKARGKISKINSELGYGFVQCGKAGEVFFSAQTSYSGTAFDSLKVDDQVQVQITETERGLFAEKLELDRPLQRSRTPEATI
jgi:cold shock CspA family protein